MPYPPLPDYDPLLKLVTQYSQLKHEYGAKGVGRILRQTEKDLRRAIAELKKLPIDKQMAKREPNDLPGIRRLRPNGPRRLTHKFNASEYREKVEGALLGRFAGCTLGSPVEFWPIQKMKDLARETEQSFPPVDYWTYVPEPYKVHYTVAPRWTFARGNINGVPSDDDLTYTQLGMLILEKYGPDFTTDDVAKAWLEHLPFVPGTAALRNLQAGVPAMKAGEKDNPQCEWIGADIRSDPWGYAAPGWPERAAEMAHRDAYVSHRRQGIYGEMFFSAVIAAAFAVDHPVEALKIGLTEIPRQCALAKAIRWALKIAPDIADYQAARDAMNERFAGMHNIHTTHNACLVVWGLTIGGTDFTKVIGQTVAMGMDNDCTAATAGSIVGAIVGKKGIPEHWHRNFNNVVYSYIPGKPKFSISGMIRRFTKQARRVCS